jgi:hypothetical protein
MMQGKQAKIVSPLEERAMLGSLATTCYPARDRVMFLWKRNKKVAVKHGFEGARERIVAWNGWQVCASASPLGGQCHFSSPRVLHS